jgi:serine/threonine protein kinase
MAIRAQTQAEPIPGYRLIERLGGGGFGEVWRCEAPGGLHKAIKFVFGDLSSAGDNGQRAEQELKAMARVKTVRHPYILNLERYDIIDGQLIIVMELADRNLLDRFKECRAQGLPGIPRDELLGYLDESAEALDLMNVQYQLQHLDIKPQNLFLVGSHVKVADFGLVKDLEGSQASVTGGITPVYAAPETFDGKVSRYSDQYSLAIVYQELLTGQRPFTGANVRQLILQHLQAVPNVAPLPAADRPAIARALAKNPDERFPTCKELVRALRAGGEAPRRGPAPAPSAFEDSSDSASHTTNHLVEALGKFPRSEAPATPPQAPLPEVRPPADTGSNQGTTEFIRGAELAGLRQDACAQRKAPMEVNGPGSLFPALVIGLGQMGMVVLQRLREHLHTHVAPLNQLPHLRLLLLDTDPEVMRSLGRSTGGPGLTANEVLLTPLNRPSHYLKPRDGRPPLERWLNPRMLYRIPRSQVTTGVRALGRLAFCDNYRTITRRLQFELDSCLEPAALQGAARQTRLGLRTNRPRVYIISTLAGGTGSGMFLDLAYTVRALLRQMGYDPPDVAGLLLLPPMDGSRTGVMTLGNTYAALTELNHFGSANTVFSARYHEREAPIQDDGPPFNRTHMLPLPDENDEVATQELIDLASQFLWRDLCQPLGRAIDLGRAGLTAPAWESRGQFFQTFGLFQLSWPRHALLNRAARVLCSRLVKRWLSKDAKPLREAVQTWAEEQWAQHELGADVFLHRLQAEVVRALGRTPEGAIGEVLEPLLAGAAPAGPTGPGPEGTQAGPPASPRRGNPRGKFSDAPAPGPEQVADALVALGRLVGQPEDEGSAEEPALLVRLLREAADRLTSEWGQKLAGLPVSLIEEPSYRLAGAEELIRLVVTMIEQVLQRHEPLAQELAQKSANAHARLRALAEPRAAGRRSAAYPGEAVELLRAYPKWRFQSLVMHHLSAAFVSLRGHLSDELREVGFCRVRLAELSRMFEETPAGEGVPGEAGPNSRQGSIGRRLYLAGCKDLAGALEQFLGRITPEDLLELDGQMEATLKKQFTALVHVCLSTGNVLKRVEEAMLQTAREFAAGRLPQTSVADLFLEQQPDEALAQEEVSAFFDESAPELSVGARRGREALSVLATPPGPAGDRFRELVQRALPDLEVQPASSPDDILIYRERNNLALSELEQMGPQARSAYMQMNAADHFTPHTRTDVEFKTP